MSKINQLRNGLTPRFSPRHYSFAGIILFAFAAKADHSSIDRAHQFSPHQQYVTIQGENYDAPYQAEFYASLECDECIQSIKQFLAREQTSTYHLRVHLAYSEQHSRQDVSILLCDGPSVSWQKFVTAVEQQEVWQAENAGYHRSQSLMNMAEASGSEPEDLLSCYLNPVVQERIAVEHHMFNSKTSPSDQYHVINSGKHD